MAKSKFDKIVSLLIPPSLILLLLVTIVELFYHVGGGLRLFIDIFDLYVVLIFAIDLYYRWLETPHLGKYLRKHSLDIIATIPFNLIFYGVQSLVLIKALRGIKFVARFARGLRFARYARLLRLVRFGARAPRFLRVRKQVKKTKIRKVQPHEKKMKGVLSFRVILLITINSIMGTGIWFLTSAGAKHAGPASLISWGLLSLISVYIAMCFSELTAMFPKAGGVYEFAKQSYGRFWSFVIGWTTSIAGSVTIAMLLLGALQYLIPIKYAFTYIPIAILLILLFSVVAYRGMQTSTVVLVTFAIITLVAVTAIIIPGFINFNPDNFTPFFVFPTMSIILAIFFIAETFFGWESAIFLSAETKNPSKVMPKALIYGTIVIAILSFFLAFTAMGTIPWADYANSVAPLRDLGAAHFGVVGGLIFTVLIFVSVIGATAGWIVTAPRLLMSIAEDKLFFTQFAKIHPKHKSPYLSIGFQAIIVSILVYIGAGQYEKLLHMLIPLILLVYSAVLLSVVILRFKKPDMKRPYKVVFGKVGPFITIGFMLFLLIMFIKETHGAMDILRISGSLILFGIPAYFAIELFYEPKYAQLRREWFSKIMLFSNKLPLPAILVNRVLSLVGPIHRKDSIVTINAPLGTVTRGIVKKHLQFGKINVYTHGKHERKVLLDNNDVRKRNITFHYQKSLNLPQLRSVDKLIVFQDLGFVKDIGAYLILVRKSITKGGKFCFHTKHHFMDMTPNAIELENKKNILKEFSGAGLKAKYLKKKKGYKTEIFIYGKK
jgi:basic amino acid/polyamine antiporter, APA family